MALFNWSNEYSVGAKLMDDHHKQLFDIMNRLYDVMDKGGTEVQSSVVPMLGELIKYTEYHFGEEERLMEQARYSGLSPQRLAHQEFVNKLKEYKDKVTNSPGMAIFVANEASMTASDWLKHHILRMDRAYESSLKSAGLC